MVAWRLFNKQDVTPINGIDWEKNNSYTLFIGYNSLVISFNYNKRAIL